MSSTSSKAPFWQGFRDAAPFVLVVGPFAAVFGVIATEAGLSIVETMLFTISVFAGAAQLTTLQLLQENTPAIIALASGLAVNLRMAMYSASLTPHLGAAPFWQRAFVAYFTVDQSYALSQAKFEVNGDWPLKSKMAYFFGSCAPIAPVWALMTFVGAMIGEQIPESAALDFAVPIAFLAIIGPMMRTPAHMLTAFVAAAASLMLTWVPYNLGVIVAASIGMVAGAQAELELRKRGLFK